MAVLNWEDGVKYPMADLAGGTLTLLVVDELTQWSKEACIQIDV